MRIFRITEQNAQATIPLLTLSEDVKIDISNAVKSGKHVSVHKDPVTLGAWRGAGYIVFDPETGSGAYLISGGLNGGGATGDDGSEDSSGANAPIFMDIISTILYQSKRITAQFLGKIVGWISKVSDFAAIVQQCSGYDLVDGLILLAGSSVISYILVANLTNPLFIVAMSILLIFVMAFLIAEFIRRECTT